MKAYVYSKNQVSVDLMDLLKRWPQECAKKELKKYMSYSLNPIISCVSMLAHPIDQNDRINPKIVIEIMCIDPGYTVYKRDEGPLGEMWNLADTDSYDLASEVMGKTSEHTRYKCLKVKPVTFPREKDAHEAISADIQKVLLGKKRESDWYNNSHGLIDEFVLKTAMMTCVKCNKGTSGRRFTDAKVPICRSCRPNNRFEGITTQTPKVIDLSKLDMPELKQRVFTKENMVHKEYVTFLSPDLLPFDKGSENTDELYTKQFLETCKSVVYDIETVTVDNTLINAIPDEVVAITASLNCGTNTNKLVMFTRKVPDEWREAMMIDGMVDTNVLLRDLRKPDLPPLPPMRVFLCKGERALIETFRDFLRRYQPHFLVSFNGHGFDSKFLIRASVSTRMKETFHGSLNHLTPLVRVNNKDPMRTVTPEKFMRPHGKYCKGLIPSSIMEVSYDSFPCMTSIDLYPLHDSSLNDACENKKVDGCKLQGVAHTDIPRLYYGRQMEFFKYALLDVIITTDLYWKDRFDAIELFIELEQLVSTPWNLAVSRQKTITAQTTTYIQFHTNGFIRKGKLRPQRLLSNAIVDDLAACMQNPKIQPKLDETLQILTDFTNGHCKCNTLFKLLPKLPEGPLTERSARSILEVQMNLIKNKDPHYTTVDAAMLLFYLMRGDIDWRPFEQLLTDYSCLVKCDSKKLNGLKNYCLYIVRVRKCLSPYHETVDLMWEAYRKHHKTDTVRDISLETFVKENHQRLMEAAKLSKEFYRSMNITPKELSGVIKEANQAIGIKLKMLPYDGALIIFNNPDINLTNPVCVLDFRSQYPNGMRNINLGLDTNVSLKKVMECVNHIKICRKVSTMKEAARILADEYVHVCFTREEDDRVDWTDYLDHQEYLSRNCVFFVRNVTSIQNHQFKAEIDSRVNDKFKSEDPSLSQEVRKKHLNKSTAKKVNINSRYGVIQSTINPRFQATVTGVGRRSIQKVTGRLRELLGAKEMYGDSVPGYTPITLKRRTVENNRYDNPFLTNFTNIDIELPWKPYSDDSGKEAAYVKGAYQILTHNGWKDVVKFVRHRCHKKIYRVSCLSGIVDVTEDHSLLDNQCKLFKPSEIPLLGIELLSVPIRGKSGAYHHHIDVSQLRQALTLGEKVVYANSQIKSEAYRIMLNDLGYEHVYVFWLSTINIYKLTWSRKPLKDISPFLATKSKIINHDGFGGSYVYDIETSVGTFNAGIGDIVIKNTDSCFTYIAGLDVFDMQKMSPEEMYKALKFVVFDVSFDDFKRNIFDKYYPVSADDPKAIREAGGSVVQELYQVIAPMLSSDALELEAEKTLCPISLPSMKKYTAYNCVTKKVLTKGLSLHQKSAIPMTKTILSTFADICVSCRNEHDLVCSLYNYLGKHVTVPIELGLVDPKSIAKPCSIDLKKVKKGTKQHTLIQSLTRDGVNFIFEKIQVRLVPIYPEGDDEDWSLCDILNQSCDDRVHVFKVKYNVLKEVLTILQGKYGRGVCEVIQALIWGEFYPDRYTPTDFEQLAIAKPEEFKLKEFSSIMSKHTVKLPMDWSVDCKVLKRKDSFAAAPVQLKKPRKTLATERSVDYWEKHGFVVRQPSDKHNKETGASKGSNGY